MSVLAGRILRTDPAYADGEAAVVVACRARDRDDALLLLEALGLATGAWRWSMPRVGRVILERCQHGQEFSANALAAWVPRRAWPLIAATVTWLAAEGVMEKTGRRVVSQSPGAKSRKIPCWRLTEAGELLAREVSPVPGFSGLADVY